MVSKMPLAVREVLTRAVHTGAEEALIGRLRDQYNDIRAGLGTHKTPAEYGAVPVDPYSHTPGFAGAQQPGMTGQVKEDFIARMGELGVSVCSGEIHFLPQLMTSDEFLNTPSEFRYWDIDGQEQTLELEAGTLAFTYCQVPVVAHRCGPKQIQVTKTNHTKHVMNSHRLDQITSKSVFQRTGEVRRLDVYFDCSKKPKG